MASSAFGVDFGEKFTRVGDASFEKNGVQILSLGSQPTFPTFFADETEKSIEPQAQLLVKLVKEQKIGKKLVRAVIPDSVCFSQIMSFSKLNQKELLSAVKYQADQFIPLPIEEVILDIETLWENQKERKIGILVVASPKKIVERIEKTIEYAGFIPESLENEMSCMLRLVSSQYFRQGATTPGSGTVLIMNVGYGSSYLYLVHSSTGIVYEMRSVKIGLELFIKELRFNLDIPESKAVESLRSIGFESGGSIDLNHMTGAVMRDLVSEMSKFILISKEKYGESVSQVYLYNHADLILSLDKKIASLLPLPVSVINLSSSVVKNPVVEAYKHNLSEYISVIASNYR